MTIQAMLSTRAARCALLIVSAIWLAMMMAPWARAGETAGAGRIVSIGGSVTEIIYALGEQERLVARDRTSTYPREAGGLPDIGYIRALSPEGVMSVNPGMIIALEGYGPPEAASVLRQAGIPLVEVPEGHDGAAILAKIGKVASALGVEDKGAALAARVSADLESAARAARGVSPKRKVLFILSMQGGRIMAAGRNTHADGIIAMAGGVNAMADVEGYKQVTDESLIQAAPDLILMMNRMGDHDVSAETVFAHPAIAPTPAAANRALVRMDGLYLLGFGPRTAQAAMELGRAIAGTGAGERSN
ncbi:MAG: hemin ABC transporter substrate-binding protein [Phyllobacteriaceae bacterium]|nr:hemin ABC transporter substrate-binding protein [Phyllobacteriaceae bacterium]MBA90316.1 hemin ABC transporter substrate-binding protein [Phyllobacteriaceae bacterium]